MSRISIFILLLFATTMQAQNILEQYIETGLESNLALKQKEYVELKSLEALKQARGMFYPSVELNARYSLANGGREISFPVGDMLNPVYNTLNMMLNDQGQPSQFPQIENQSVPFLRPQEHETRLRLIQPIFQPGLRYNHAVKMKQAEIQQIETSVYKRELVKEIKVAYFNYLSTLKLFEIYEKSRKLLERSKNIAEKLLANQQATADMVYRAQAELFAIDQEMAQAEQKKQTAGAYFNFLLNRDFEEEIIVLADSSIDNVINEDLLVLNSRAIAQRDELKQLQRGIEIADASKTFSRNKFYPTLSSVVDYGFQGTEYNFTSKDDYVQGSLLLSWNLFSGFQNRSVVQQAKFEKMQYETQLTETKSRIGLQVKSDYYSLQASLKSIESAKARLESAEKAFNIITKQYEQGMIPLIQFQDARLSYTNAEINLTLTRYDYHIKSASLERATASYELR